jgi:hypothetical protein
LRSGRHHAGVGPGRHVAGTGRRTRTAFAVPLCRPVATRATGTARPVATGTRRPVTVTAGTGSPRRGGLLARATADAERVVADARCTRARLGGLSLGRDHGAVLLAGLGSSGRRPRLLLLWLLLRTLDHRGYGRLCRRHGRDRFGLRPARAGGTRTRTRPGAGSRSRRTCCRGLRLRRRLDSRCGSGGLMGHRGDRGHRAGSHGRGRGHRGRGNAAADRGCLGSRSRTGRALAAA